MSREALNKGINELADEFIKAFEEAGIPIKDIPQKGARQNQTQTEKKDNREEK